MYLINEGGKRKKLAKFSFYSSFLVNVITLRASPLLRKFNYKCFKPGQITSYLPVSSSLLGPNVLISLF
jgi:hypothetical protein